MRAWIAWIVGIAVLLLAPGAGHGEARLVRDIETASVAPGGGFGAFHPVVFDGQVFFSANDALHGSELWRSDGTAAGTELVADICPGPCGSTPLGFAVVGDLLFFVADDGVAGRELWVSDGTQAGTRLAHDICRGGCGAFSQWWTARLVPLGNEVFFAPDVGSAGHADGELWKSDGTAEGTTRITDLVPSGDPELVPLAAFAGRVLFVVSARELWVTDGTAAGTRLVTQLCPGNCWSFPRILGEAGGRLLVSAEDAGSRARLWSVSATGASQPFQAPCPTGCSGPAAGAPLGDVLVVAVQAGAGQGYSLLRVDPRTGAAETLLVLAAGRRAASLTAAGGRVFFAAHGGGSTELWVTDASAAGTRRLAAWPEEPFGDPFAITPFAEGVAFGVHAPGVGREPWTSDGSPGGTSLLRDLAVGSDDAERPRSSDPFGFVELGGRLLFAAATPETGHELFASDGSEAGTEIVRRVLDVPGSARPTELASDGERLYFAARGADREARAWISDGTTAGTRPLLAGPPASTADPREFTPFGGSVHFAAWGPLTDHGHGRGRRLWKTDGTEAGTRVVSGPRRSVRALTAGEDRLFLLGDPLDQACPGGCEEPFVLELGEEAATQVAEINPHTSYYCCIPEGEFPASCAGHDLVVAAGRLYLGADDGETGDEPWISDGTAAGTRLLADVCSGECGSAPAAFLPWEDGALFVTRAGWTGLWRTDGTPAGTVQVAPLPGLDRWDPPRGPVAAGRRAYLLVETFSGDELWATDGTAAGTARVSALALDGSRPRASALTAVGDRVFFAVAHQATGEELWTSDGTEAWTLPLETAPGPWSGSPRSLRAVDGLLVFAARDASSGLEPWVSDGTPEGTYRLADVAPGPDASAPADFTPAGDWVYFSAGERAHGRELWALPRAALSRRRCAPGPEALCLHDGRFRVTARWRADAAGGEGAGRAVATGDQGGLFWFFSSSNVELLVKLLDGGAVNGRFWLFVGALSDVDYSVTVEDLGAEVTRTWHHAAGDLCGIADTSALAGAGGGGADAGPGAAAAGGCSGDPLAACVQGGRFRVEIEFADPLAGGARRPARVLAGTDETALFYFFEASNPEVAVKVLDGTGVNGRHWVLHGGLTDLAHTITVTDTLSGARRSYSRPGGTLCGGADTAAF